MTCQNLSGQNLSGQNLSGQNLSGQNLSGQDVVSAEAPSGATCPPVRLPAELASLATVAGYVRHLGEAAGMPGCAIHRLRLAADELVTNIVVHGYHGGPGTIEMCGWFDPYAVHLRLTDATPAFDPRAHVRPPPVSVPLAERRVGGMGLFLVMASVTGLDYVRAGDRNVTTLHSARGTSAEPAPADEGDA
jgi:serine/threonine-protein kinase RsbW